MNLEDIKQNVAEDKKKFEYICKVLNANVLQKEINEIDEKLHSMTSFDAELTVGLNKKRRSLEMKLDRLNKISQFFSSVPLYLEILEDDVDANLQNEFEISAKNMRQEIENFWIETMLNEKYDNAGAVLTVHSGAGGEEAQDWAEMLARMFLRYAEKQNYSAQIIDIMPGDGAGIKSETILIEGDKAFGFLKCESGVHRLVRISPFDANKRRHTSFASVEVSPLLQETGVVDILDKDLKIDTYRSSGAGGQHVNKTESAVRITHIPTGIIVACQNERSQIQNKEKALQILAGKLAEKAEMEKREQELKVRGESKKIEWGSQIRSYVLHPYNMVKDHRTNVETSDTAGVLDGEIQKFINEYLKERNI